MLLEGASMNVTRQMHIALTQHARDTESSHHERLLNVLDEMKRLSAADNDRIRAIDQIIKNPAQFLSPAVLGLRINYS